MIRIINSSKLRITLRRPETSGGYRRLKANEITRYISELRRCGVTIYLTARKNYQTDYSTQDIFSLSKKHKIPMTNILSILSIIASEEANMYNNKRRINKVILSMIKKIQDFKAFMADERQSQINTMIRLNIIETEFQNSKDSDQKTG